MVFNSLLFVLFFAFVLVLHRMPFSWRQKKINLLVLSYLFYSAWNPPFVILLWIATVVDWIVAQKLVRAEKQWSRRMWMLISVVVNLGILAWFKYGQFLADNFALLAQSIGWDWQPAKYDIVLPVGISFYTFATLSYTLDIYLRRAKPAKNFLDYALFVTFFPHLVAGPIMRPTELVPQFEEPRQANGQQLRFGLFLITLGLFQKVVIADGFLAPVVEKIYDAKEAVPGFIDSWMATFAFSGQIFCDFAGYSTTAIGVALCLGFAMPDNFRFPYAAVGFSDFWRRWHITLSTWLRDYLYIPLGGNRYGPSRTMMALMGTMLIGGLWHGASWTFVVWGGLHGAFLVIERLLRGRFGGLPPGFTAAFLGGVVTYLLINVTWVFFRATSFEKASVILKGMAGLNGGAEPMLAAIYLVTTTLFVSAIVAAHCYMRDKTLEIAVARVNPTALGLAWALMAFAVIFEQGAGNAFIYFQF